VVDAADYVAWRNDPNRTRAQYGLRRARFGRTAAVATGDFNGNGFVDAADYVVWRKNDGTINTQDHYNIWRSHFGQTVGSGAAAGNIGAADDCAS
jgi:hypothetical protein